MARHLYALSSGDTTMAKEPTQIEQMLQLVEKYRHFGVPKLSVASGSANGVLKSKAVRAVI